MCMFNLKLEGANLNDFGTIKKESSSKILTKYPIGHHIMWNNFGGDLLYTCCTIASVGDKMSILNFKLGGANSNDRGARKS